MLKHVYMDEEPGQGGGGDGPTIEDLRKQIDDLQASIDTTTAENQRLQAKVSEANKHTKAAEKAAAEEARKKAEAEGNFEQLFKSSEESRSTLQSEFDTLKNTVATEKCSNVAMEISSQLADGANAKILSRFVGERLKYTDEGVKVTDINGNLTVSTYDDLINEFKGSAEFASLIKGNQSSGGSANGGDNSGGSTATMSRADFANLNPVEQRKFLKEGKVVDD